MGIKGIAPLLVVGIIVLVTVGAIGGYVLMNKQADATDIIVTSGSKYINYGQAGTSVDETSLLTVEDFAGEFIIEGNKVYVDDENLYLSATPHTIYNSRDVEFELISKVYSGEADIMFGFDYPETKPRNAFYYNPHEVSEQKSYTCNEPYYYNYTLDPKMFYCWENQTISINNDTGVTEYKERLVFSHSFETADENTNTAYWTETYNEDWVNVANEFNSIDYEYQGMNKWYYTTFNVNAGQSYKMKSFIEVPFDVENLEKYWVCIKPSSESFSQAVSNGHFYCLDPWYDSNWDYYKNISIDYTNGKTVSNATLSFNITYESSMNANFSDLRFINSTGHELNFWKDPSLGADSSWAWFEVRYGYLTANTSPNELQISMYYGNSDATSTSNCADSFVWCDDFSTDTTADYSTSRGYCESRTIADGILNITGNSGGAGADSYCWTNYTGQSFDIGKYAYETREKYKDVGGTPDVLGLAWNNGTTLSNINGFMIRPILGSSNFNFYGKHDTTTHTSFSGGTSAVDTWYRLSEWDYNNNTFQASVYNDDYSLNVGINVFNDTEAGYVNENVWLQTFVTWVSARPIKYVDYLRVREMTSPYSVNYEVGEEVYYRINFDSQQYDSNIYELETTRFNISVYTFESNVSKITGDLWWNGTNVSHTTYTNTSTTDYTFNKTLTPNLTLTNATSIPAYWNFSIIFNNGTQLVNQTTQSFSQTLIWSAYFDTPTSSDATPTATDSVQLNSTLVENPAITTSNKKIYINGTAYSTSNDGTEYYKTYTTPMVSTATTFSYYFDTYVTYSGTTLNRSTSTETFEIQPINLTDCSVGEPIITYYYYDEDDPTHAVNATKEVTYKVWKTSVDDYAEFNFTFPANYSHTVCLDPNTTINILSDELYGNVTGDGDGRIYPERKYHILCDSFSNDSRTVINNYLINSSVSQVTSIQVVDGSDVPIQDAYVKARRYYIGENVYRNVAMAHTDANGESTMRLIPSTQDIDVFYEFNIYEGCSLSKTFDKMNVVGTSIIFPVAEDTSPMYWDTWNDITWSCTWTNSTAVLICDYEDHSDDGLVSLMQLYVQQLNTTDGFTEICNDTSTSDVDSLICDLSGMTTETYQYWLITTYDGEQFILESDILKNIGAGLFDTSGIFLAAIMLIGISLIGFNDPKLMIVMSVVAVGFNHLIGFTTGTWAGVACLAIAAGLILYKG